MASGRRQSCDRSLHLVRSHPPGTALTTYRVWWHFVANLVGTAILAVALHHLWRERRGAGAGEGAAATAGSTPPGPESAPPEPETALAERACT